MNQNDMLNKAEWEEECRDAKAATRMVGGMVLLFAVACVAAILAFVLANQTGIREAITWVQANLDATFGGAFALIGLALFREALFGKQDLTSRSLAAVLGFLLVATGGNMLVSALIN